MQIAHAAAQILAHGSPRGAYKAAAGLLKLNGLLVHDIIVERTERQLVGASFYVMNEWDFVLFEIEEGDEHASFQLGDALDAELGKPLLQFHEIYLVASGSQVVSQLDDSSEIDSVSQHSIYVCHDDAQQINGLDRGIDGVAFIFLNLAEPSVQKTVVHLHLSGRNIIHVLEHLSYLFLLKGSHRFHFFLDAEVVGTEFSKKVALKKIHMPCSY